MPWKTNSNAANDDAEPSPSPIEAALAAAAGLAEGSGGQDATSGVHRSGTQVGFDGPVDSLPIAQVVILARTLTGKVPRKSDGDLATWLSETHEIENQGDLARLSDESFAELRQAPGMSLLLYDCLTNIRRGAPVPMGKRRASARVSVAVPKGDGTNMGTAESSRTATDRLCEVELRDVAGGQDPIGIVTMKNYSKRNVFSHRMCVDMETCVMECMAAGVRAIILRAAPGVKVWSAGHDIRDFKRIDGSDAQTGQSVFQDPLSRDDVFVRLLSSLHDLEVPLIGCIEGTVWGAATDVCACCDFLVGTPDCSFAITPVKLGIPYHASGLAHFIQVMPLHVVKWMFMSGLPLSAADAHRYGFLNFLVPAEELTAKAEEMATVLASRAPLVMLLLKRQLNALIGQPALPAEVFEELHLMRKNCWSSNDMNEGIKSFFEKSTPVFTGR